MKKQSKKVFVIRDDEDRYHFFAVPPVRVCSCGDTNCRINRRGFRAGEKGEELGGLSESLFIKMFGFTLRVNSLHAVTFAVVPQKKAKRAK